MDKIIIKDLELYAYHGVNQEEKENGQLFSISLECEAELSAACKSDELCDTVNYAKIIKLVRRVFLLEKYNLIERAAYVTAAAILEEFSAISAVNILLKKPNAPISAKFDYVAVELNVKRG